MLNNNDNNNNKLCALTELLEISFLPFLILRGLSADSVVANLHIFLSLSCSFLIVARWLLSFSANVFSHYPKVKFSYPVSQKWPISVTLETPGYFASPNKFCRTPGERCSKPLRRVTSWKPWKNPFRSYVCIIQAVEQSSYCVILQAFAADVSQMIGFDTEAFTKNIKHRQMQKVFFHHL